LHVGTVAHCFIKLRHSSINVSQTISPELQTSNYKLQTLLHLFRGLQSSP
jgi:hypothetical protein